MPDTRPRPGMGVAGMYEDSMASEMPCVDAMWTPTKPAPRNMPVQPRNSQASAPTDHARLLSASETMACGIGLSVQG